MYYRNGKCYDSKGNEMSLSQINQMVSASEEYIKQKMKNKANKEISSEDIYSKLKDNPIFNVSKNS